MSKKAKTILIVSLIVVCVLALGYFVFRALQDGKIDDTKVYENQSGKSGGKNSRKDTNNIGTTTDASFDAKKTKDVVYAEVDGTPLLLDVYLAPGENNNAVMFFAGGDGTHKNRGEEDAELFSSKGISVFSVNTAPAPSQDKIHGYLYNAKAATRFVRAHADDYGIDPDSIFAAGGSFGGTTSALLGVTGDLSSDEEFEGTVGDYLSTSSAVSGSMVLYASTYFNQVPNPVPTDEKFAKAFSALFGCPDYNNCPEANWLKPYQYITPNDPPFLIIHGTEDTSATPSQAQMLYDALSAEGVEAELIWAEGYGHDPELFEIYLDELVSFIENN